MPFLAPLAGGVLGAITGAAGKKETISQTSGLNLAAAGGAENAAGKVASDSLQSLSDYTNAGPGEQDISGSVGATRSLADMLKQLSETGGLPTQADVQAGGAVADNIFAPRQTALDQSFIKQNTDAQRLSAQLGRSVDDPILQAKLRTGFMQQSDLLNADKTSYGGQIALGLPGQRVQYAGQRADIMGNLATQAFNNRSALLGLGSNLQNLDRNFRVQTAQKYSTGESTSGGGLGGAISGAIGGLGAGLSIMNQFGAGGTGGAGGGGQPSAMGVSGYGPTVAGADSGIGSMGAYNGPSPTSYGFGPSVASNSNMSYAAAPRTLSLGAPASSFSSYGGGIPYGALPNYSSSAPFGQQFAGTSRVNY